MNIEKFVEDCKPALAKYLSDTDEKFEGIEPSEILIVYNGYNEIYVNIKTIFKRFEIEKIDYMSFSSIDGDTMLELFSERIGDIISVKLINEIKSKLYIGEDSDCFTFENEGILYSVRER